MKIHWKKFSGLLPATALVFMDQTILPVALPQIRQEMIASGTQLQWCVNSYLLAIAMFVLACGKWGDRIGHKQTLIWGMVGFVISSILCSLSQSVGFLIGARALQGFSAAWIFPAQSAMATTIFPPEKRGKATGMIVSFGSLFLILGPLIGGYLVKVASWRWIFWINLPIGIIGIWMIHHFLPQTAKGKGRIDLFGFIYFALGISALTVAFMEVVDWGWTSSRTLSVAGIALLGFLLMLYREKRADHPFLDLALFKYPVFFAINITIFFVQFFMMITVFRTVYFQEVLGFSPLTTGFMMFLSSVPVLFMAPYAGILSDRFSPKLPLAIGYVLLIFSSLWFAFIGEHSMSILLVALIIFGMGIPMIFTPSYSAALKAVPKAKVGTASGIITTLRMTGGTIGLAMIHFFAGAVQAHYSAEGQHVASEKSFSDVHFALAILLIFSFIVAFSIHARKSAHHLPQGPAEGWD